MNSSVEIPNGAIENGRAFLQRLVDHYDFTCEAGSLANCTDYHEAVRCFEHITQWVSGLSAAPHLPAVRVKALDWQTDGATWWVRGNAPRYEVGVTAPWGVLLHFGSRRITHVDGDYFPSQDAAKAAAEADNAARILSALEPSAACELALVDALEVAKNELQAWIKCADENGLCVTSTPHVIDHIDIAIASLSSPDHADAGKVEGDGCADLERFWRPISEADKSITFEQTCDLGDGKSMTIRNSDYYWVRDADGRVYEATWSDHKNGYWWDLEGESPVDPVEYMPHPLSLPTAPSQEVA